MTENTIGRESILAEEFQRTHCPIAFGKLYELFYQPVYDYIYRFVKDPHLAFDLTQETFLTVFEKFDSLREVKALRLWIFRIAKNHTMKHFWSQSKEEIILKNLSIFSQYNTPEMDDLLKRENQYNLMLNSIEQLNEQEKELLVNKYYNNMSINDLVARTGLGNSAIKMKIHRARTKIKDCMIKEAV